MKIARKIAVRMLIASFLVGLPGAALAQTTNQTPQTTTTDGECTSFRCEALSMFVTAATQMMVTGCEATASVITGLVGASSSS